MTETQFAKKLYHDWITAFESIGEKPMSDDTVARLLAVVYVFGGGQEQFLFQTKALEDILYAQRRANINGAEIPDAEITADIKRYVAELEGKKASETWAAEWCKKRYDITLYD